ncbi:MAG: hypothetical protein U5O39_07865 [Gammaproteobacteria bacterium]|nr:hypothetical protein [Gammaproteobacteria bacterium]
MNAGDLKGAWNIKLGMTIVGGLLILVPAVLLEDWLESSFSGGQENLVFLALSFAYSEVLFSPTLFLEYGLALDGHPTMYQS